MRLLIAALALVAALATPAAATTFNNCAKAEQQVIGLAVSNAKSLALGAAVTVGETEEYDRWFGKFAAPYAEEVRGNFKAIYEAMRSGALTVTCVRKGDVDCEGDTYAFVYPTEPYLMYLCPPFFEMPTMARYQPGSSAIENGTREGTLIHEMSHFAITAGTDDNCYSRTDCASMALRDARAAVENADSYQYFAEDVAYFVRRPEAQAAALEGIEPPPDTK